MAVQLYRVIGIRHDGSRRILADGVPKEVADKTAGLMSAVFDDVAVEPAEAPQNAELRMPGK